MLPATFAEEFAALMRGDPSGLLSERLSEGLAVFMRRPSKSRAIHSRGAKKERPETQSRRPVSFESPDLSMGIIEVVTAPFQPKYTISSK